MPWDLGVGQLYKSSYGEMPHLRKSLYTWLACMFACAH